MSHQCTVCGKRAYSSYCVQHKPRKPITAQKATVTNHCKICDSDDHTAFYCKEKAKSSTPKQYKNLKMNGKYHKQWLKVRKQWFKDHPQDWYVCYICHKSLVPAETTLDHVIPRSRRPDLRYEPSNLKPCCWPCNTEKGSKSL